MDRLCLVAGGYTHKFDDADHDAQQNNPLQIISFSTRELQHISL
jgi:hypothetical protein